MATTTNKREARGSLAEKIGKRIRKLRGTRTMAEFAELFDAVPGTLANYETGKNLPGSYVLAEIARHEGVNLNWLVLGKGTPHN